MIKWRNLRDLCGNRDIYYLVWIFLIIIWPASHTKILQLQNFHLLSLSTCVFTKFPFTVTVIVVVTTVTLTSAWKTSELEISMVTWCSYNKTIQNTQIPHPKQHYLSFPTIQWGVQLVSSWYLQKNDDTQSSNKQRKRKLERALMEEQGARKRMGKKMKDNICIEALKRRLYSSCKSFY